MFNKVGTTSGRAATLAAASENASVVFVVVTPSPLFEEVAPTLAILPVRAVDDDDEEEDALSSALLSSSLPVKARRDPHWCISGTSSSAPSPCPPRRVAAPLAHSDANHSKNSEP
jgi:hypothetical protein